MSAIFSVKGKGLKFDSRADIEAHLKDVDPTAIEEVQFAGNTIGIDASASIGEFLAKATKLKVADFSDIFTGRTIDEIPTCLLNILTPLSGSKTLLEIDLSDNAFGKRAIVAETADGETSFAPEDMLPFPKFLATTPGLRVLRLSNNGFGPFAAEVIADAISKNAANAPGGKGNLRAILCGRNRLEIGGNTKWEAALAAHPDLRVLRLPQNGIRMPGVTALARGLSKSKHVRHLDFQDNTFTLAEKDDDEEDDDDVAEGEQKGVDGQAGVKEWSRTLPQLHELRELNLSDCFLTSEQLAADGVVSELILTLAKGSNPSLRVLRLQNNNFAAETFTALHQALSTNKGLDKILVLDLEANDVDEDHEVVGQISDVLKGKGGILLMGEESEEGIEVGADEDLKEEHVTQVDESVPAKAPQPAETSLKPPVDAAEAVTEKDTQDVAVKPSPPKEETLTVPDATPEDSTKKEKKGLKRTLSDLMNKLKIGSK